MPILSKGYTFGSTEQVTSTKLGNLVDNATFASGACASGGGVELSSGQLQIANGGVTPTRLSTGAPSWDGSGNLTVTGTITSGGSISTSNDIAANGTLTVNGVSTLTGNVTCAGQILRSGTASNRTVQLRTGSATPNAISFGFSSGELLVTVDGTEYTIALTPA